MRTIQGLSFCEADMNEEDLKFFEEDTCSESCSSNSIQGSEGILTCIINNGKIVTLHVLGESSYESELSSDESADDHASEDPHTPLSSSASASAGNGWFCFCAFGKLYSLFLIRLSYIC